MTTNPTTPKRWRPRFSVRTLVILVTLVCCYAACWGPTKNKGVDDVINVRNEMLMDDSDASDASAMMPLLVRTDQTLVRAWDTNGLISTSGTRHYYFWFFGCVAKLPYERDW